MRKEISILYITYDGVMEPVGSSQVLAYLKRLSEHGMRFILISFEKGPCFNDTAGRRDLKATLQKHGIEWHALRFHKRARIIATVYDILRGAGKGIALARKHTVEIVHARSYVAGIMAQAVSALTKVPFVFDMRGFWADERVDAGLLHKDSLLYRAIKGIERALVHRARRIIVLTHKAKDELPRLFDSIDANKIDVIPCCTDVGRFRFDADARGAIRAKLRLTDRVVFVHAGSLIGWYMIREMLDCFRSIKRLEPKASFLLLSRDADRGRFFSVVDSLSIAHSDIMLTEAPFHRMPEYLSAADGALFFIKPTFSKKASCPIKLAEYLSCGLPIICNTNVGDLDTIVKMNAIGVLVDRFTDASYRDAFRQYAGLIGDTELKMRCRKTAESELSLEKGTALYVNAYRECLT